MVDGKKSRGFEELEVWRLSIHLAKEIYIATKNFPRDEIYGLTNHRRRSAVSISSNIAEGSSRNSAADFARFIGIAIGSTSELKSQIIVAREIGYLGVEEVSGLIELANQVGRMLKGLQRSLKA